MHSYLRSIGFSDIKNRRQLTPITKEIIANPTTKNIVTVDADTRLVQLNKDFGKHFGISLVGEMDIDNTISFEYYFPYVRSSFIMNQERIYIEKHGDKESYAGVCEDYNLGMTLIFFLTNISDYANTKWMNYSNHLITKAYMSGLSTSGKVILDIEQLFQDLCPGGTRSDAASFDLGTQFFILNQLTGILHCQNHRTGCIAFRR